MIHLSRTPGQLRMPPPGPESTPLSTGCVSCNTTVVERGRTGQRWADPFLFAQVRAGFRKGYPGGSLPGPVSGKLTMRSRERLRR